MQDNNKIALEVIEPITESKQAIVFACDDAYAPLVAVAIVSLIHCYKGNERLQIVILSNGVSKLNKQKLHRLANNNCSLEFFECSSLLKDYRKLIHNQRLNESIFSRIYVIDLFQKFNKILYLDADLVFNVSVDELLSVTLTKPVMVVPDIFIETYRNIVPDMGEYLKNELGLSSQDRYFNSGVILFDIQKCRGFADFSDLIALMKSKKYRWEDQDVLNIFFHNNFDICDYRWNTIWLQNPDMQNVLEQNLCYRNALMNPAIVHYAGGVLPIKCVHSRFAWNWWKYAAQTEYLRFFLSEYLRLLVKKFFSKMRAAFCSTLHSRSINRH